MTNLEVTIYLNTPLIPTDYRSKATADEISRIKGKIISEHASGYILQVKTTGNPREWFDNPSHLKRIFLPLHKVDFMVLD